MSLWREAIEKGLLLGPRIVMAGFLIDGFKWPGNISATNAEEGREAVEVLKKTGVDFVKVKSCACRGAAAEASDAGQKSIEHLTGVALGCSGAESRLMNEKRQAFAARDWARYDRIEARAIESFDADVAGTLFGTFVRNGTWQVPTLVELCRNAQSVQRASSHSHKGCAGLVSYSWLEPTARILQFFRDLLCMMSWSFWSARVSLPWTRCKLPP